MELKRYVLLDKKEIIDTSKEIFYFKGENQLYRDRPNAPQVTVRIGTAIKTSNDILDLVEFGDLVELKNYTRIVHIHNQRWLDDFLSKVQEPEEDEFKLKDSIVAIYKRQPNGDYKKYEVKK